MIRTGCLIFLFFILCGFDTKPPQPIFHIIPQPKQVFRSGSVFSVKCSNLYFEKRDEFRSGIEFFNSLNGKINNFEIPYSDSKDTALRKISIEPLNNAKKEQYEIQINKNEIRVLIGTDALIHSLTSLIQIFHQFKKDHFLIIPQAVIKDEPSFSWRGMHLDVCRHFFKVDFIKKYIDLLAFYKMNVFHWHLTEDQGWRIEIKKYPRLTEIGAWRKGSMIGHYNEQRYDTISYGGFYTQDEIKDIVSYAKVRGVTIVPEIELPGHALAALAAYPELSCSGGPFQVAQGWGVFEDVFCPKESTFLFIENVLSEVCDLFPGEYIHIGGDECPKIRWKNCSHCQNLMKKEGLHDEHELQSYFIRRIEKLVNSKGKKIIGWDEILEGGLAPNAAVMSWRGTEGGIAAAKMKHQVVMTPGSHCYFDHYQGYPANEPTAIGGYTTLQKVYSYNPRDEKLSDEEKTFVMGAQGNVWTEYMATTKQVEYMVFPRLLALSEVLWFNHNTKTENEEFFLDRTIQHLFILEALKVNYSESMFQVNWETEIKNNQLQLKLTGLSGAKIFYQLTPLNHVRNKMNLRDDQYDGPIIINQSCMLRAYLELKNGDRKRAVTQKIFVSKATTAKIELEPAASKSYPGKGAFTLIDGLRAAPIRINSEWLAWAGTDVNMMIDLGVIDTISMINLGYMQDEINWIYAPREMIVSTSTDGKKFKIAATLKQDEINKLPRDIMVILKAIPAQYLKITIKNFGKIPDGKPGAGNNSWLFLDEILIY